MLAALDRPLAPATRFCAVLGGGILRYGLVLFLVGIGALKFTEAEAQAIQPLVANSPLLGWLYAVLSVQAASNLIGMLEIALGVLIASSRWLPRLSVIGSLGASVMFLITISFLFTTPGLSPDMAGFLAKDLMLLGAALWTAADSLVLAQRRAEPRQVADTRSAAGVGERSGSY